MRKWISATLVSAGVGVATLATAADDPREMQPEAKAYFTYHFDGRGAAADNELVYGLRIDHDHRYTSRNVPAIAKLEFGSRQGFNQLQVNGMPIAYRSYQLNQDGTTSTEYSWVDWGLVAVAVAGIGYVLYDVIDADESPSPTPSSTPVGLLPPAQQDQLAALLPGGSEQLQELIAGGGTLEDLAAQLPGGQEQLESIIGQVSPGYTGNERFRPQLTRHTPEYQHWLDGDTGHMGDLFAPQ